MSLAVRFRCPGALLAVCLFASLAGASVIVDEYDAAVDADADTSWLDMTNDEVNQNAWTLDAAASAGAVGSSRVGISEAFTFDADGALPGGTSPSFAPVNDASGDVAFEIWFRPRKTSDNAYATSTSDLTGRDDILFETGGGNGAALHLNGATIEFDASGMSTRSASLAGLLDDFVQVVGVIDEGADEGRLYVNGALQGAPAVGVGNWEGNDNAGLARNQNNNLVAGGGFTGDIARNRMLSHDIGDSRVQALFEDVASNGPAVNHEYQNLVFTDGAARHYRLDESPGSPQAIDSGAGFDGTYAGGVTLGVASLVPGDPGGTAAEFDGASGKIHSFGDRDFLGGESVTYEFWFLTHDAEADQVILDTGGTNSVMFTIEDDKTAADGAGVLKAGRRGGGATDTFLGLAIETGTVYHVAMVFDNEDFLTTEKGLFAYLDGTKVDEDLALTADVNPGAPFVVGTFNGNSDAADTNWFDGVLDELAVYNRVLTADEIGLHAQGYVPEPATVALVALGGAGLLLRRRR